jgi:hypothetical protein
VYRDTQLAQIANVTGKNRAIPGLYRDSFPGLTGQVQGRLLRHVTFTKLYCRAVMCKVLTFGQLPFKKSDYKI